MSDRPPFPLLREPAWTIVRNRVEALGVRDRRMRHASELLLRPLRLLESLAADTPGTLSDDALAAERLRHLLYLASPWSALVGEAEKLMKGADDEEPEPTPAGILDLALLVIVGLAAARVAPNRRLGHVFLQTVHGLALSAAPAEMLGRLGSHAHEGAVLAEVVNLMVLPDAARLTESRLFLPRFALDPAERGRWSCLQRFFSGALTRALDETWNDWLLRAPADAIEMVDPTDAAPGGEVTLRGKFPSLASGEWPRDLSVLFYSAARPPLAAAVRAFDTRRVVVVVPGGARAGWVGLPDPRALEAHNRARGKLRRGVISLSPKHDPAKAACLVQPVPVDTWLADLPLPPLSPRTAHNRYQGAAPAPPAAKEGREYGVVFHRPVVLSPQYETVSDEELEQALAGLSDAGWRVRALELPWVPDGLAVLSTRVTSADDPRVPRLLECAARTAVLTPGLEDALHVLLVPGARALSVQVPAEAAAGVAVATAPGLPRVLQKTFPRCERESPREATTRLRLLARRTDTGACLLESVREETQRAAGPGAPYDTGLEAVAFAERNLEMHRFPVSAFRKAGPAPLDLLFPISPEVIAVEIQSKGRTMQRIERVLAPPELSKVKVRNATVTWEYRHASGAPPRISIEAGRAGLFTPFLPVDASCEEVRLPLHRLAPGTCLRLVAGDGWNAVLHGLDARPPAGPAVTARRVTPGQWWADVPPSWPVLWTFGKSTSRERIFRTGEAAKGFLQLSARDPRTGARRTDQRSIGGDPCET